MKDTVIEEVVDETRERSEKFIEEYGQTLDRKDLTLIEWMQHAKEESMDFTNYIHRAKRDVVNMVKERDAFIKQAEITRRMFFEFLTGKIERRELVKAYYDYETYLIENDYIDKYDDYFQSMESIDKISKG